MALVVVKDESGIGEWGLQQMLRRDYSFTEIGENQLSLRLFVLSFCPDRFPKFGLSTAVRRIYSYLQVLAVAVDTEFDANLPCALGMAKHVCCIVLPELNWVVGVLGWSGWVGVQRIAGT